MIQFVRADHGMEAETRGSSFHCLAVGAHDLFVGNAVLGLDGVADYGIAGAPFPGVVPETDERGKGVGDFVDQGFVIKVQDASASIRRRTEFERGGVV